ncbi:MAG: type IX secretion system protein PorQ [Flavobacteriales bacterium]
MNLTKTISIKSLSLFFFAAILFVSSDLFSQLGGTNSYQFLDLSNSSRIQALGGNNISIYDNDVNLNLSNPALLDSTKSGSIALNYMNYVSDINYGFTSYTKHFDNIGTFNAAIMYANYGDFVRADEAGVVQGNFAVNDLAMIIGYGRKIDSLFSVGANLKFFQSLYDVYTSNGIAIDLAANYYKPSQEFSASFVMKNIGFSFSSYTENESLPFEIQLGLTKKLKHAPFRFSLTFTNLQVWDLTYDDPNVKKEFDPNTFEELPPKEPSFLDKAMRHVVFGTEFVLSKNFNIQIGYNYRRRQELKFNEKTGLIGFSGGIAFKIKKFNLNYSISNFHLAGNSHSFSITTNMHNFRTKN